LRRWRATVVTLSVLTRAFSARALVLSEDPFAGDSVAAGANARMYNLVLRGGPLSAAERNPAAVSIVALRPWFELKRSSGFALFVHDELTSMTSSLPAGEIGGPLSLGRGAQAPRWLALEWTAASGPTYALRDRVDWLYARYAVSDVTISVGRQPLTLGRGRIWTPEDLIAPFSPLQFDTEYKPGADAARVDWTPSASATLSVIAAAAKHGDSAVIAHGELAVDRARVGLLLGSVRTDLVSGLDLFVDVGKGADLHGEATFTVVTDAARRPWGRRAFTRGVLGTTAELSSKLHVTAEGYFNGAGARTARDYAVELASPRVAVGEAYTVGRAYAGLAADWQPHPLLHAELATIANLEDPSAIFAPTLRYSVAENASLVAGAYVPLGRAPEYSGSMTLRSEFGLYPQLYHLDAKLWF
jgi:hypothetical protein